MRREGNAIIVSVGDLIRVGADFWEVVGIHLGVVGQSDHYHVQPITLREQPEEERVPRHWFEGLLSTGGAIGYSPLKETP